MKDRKSHAGGEAPRNLMPMSEVLTRMVKNIDDRYYIGDQWQYYCPENANWMSYGWIGGLMNTYPMLALGDAEHLQKVKNTFDFALPKGKADIIMMCWEQTESLFPGMPPPIIRESD